MTQSQCWSLVRYIIAQYKKSPRLPGDSTPDPLLELSQGKAIAAVVPVLSEWLSQLYERIPPLFRPRCRDGRNLRSQDQPVESPIFGIASIVVILFFLFMGVAIPWWLTEGALGTPIVKSKITEDCLKSDMPSHLLDILNRETRADEIFGLCRDELNAGCDSPYHLSDPQITKTRPTTCPFGGNICLNTTPSFEVTHWNISAFEMGVNSRSKLSMNQRLTCAPISLDPFLWKFKDGSVIYIPKLQSQFKLWSNVSLTLSTTNGLNKFSNESSGVRMFEEKGPFDLTVLPRYTAGTNYFGNPEPLELNELLQRNDSQSFLVIHRAGAAQYSMKVDDPFFSAHNKAVLHPDHPDVDSYCPDYEATALGCVEQFQYCFPPSPLPIPCTDWGARNQQFSAMLNYLSAQFSGDYNGDAHSVLEHSNDQFLLSVNEMLSLFKLFPARFSVYDYLTMRIDVHKMVPLTRRKTLVEEFRWLDDDTEQWVIEVETWFMKAFLSGLLAIQDGALYTLLDLDSGFSPEYIREWKLCGRILFHNQDFTNINWVGFWITIASLTLVLLVGNQVSTIHEGLKYCSEMLSKWMKRTIYFLTKLPGFIRHTRRSETQAGKVWNVSLLFQSLSRVRPWYGGSSEPNAAPNATEMNDLEIPPTVPREDDPSSTEEYWDVDDPI